MSLHHLHKSHLGPWKAQPWGDTWVLGSLQGRLAGDVPGSVKPPIGVDKSNALHLAPATHSNWGGAGFSTAGFLSTQGTQVPNGSKHLPDSFVPHVPPGPTLGPHPPKESSTMRKDRTVRHAVAPFVTLEGPSTELMVHTGTLVITTTWRVGDVKTFNMIEQ